MKKGIIIVFFALVGIAQTQAQVTFKPGLRGGLNFSHFTQGDFYGSSYYDYNTGSYINSIDNTDYTSKTDLYVGFYGALHLTKYYTLQPEINYSRQGSNIETINNNVISRTKFDISYLSIGMINKFTFTEKFNFHVGPTLDFVVDKPRFLVNKSSTYFDTDSDIDLAFVAGFGYNFTKNIGLEARVKKGIIPVFDYSDSNHTNVVFSVGATYTFDIK